MATLLSFGLAVVHSDVDAVWKQDPIPYLSGAPADMLLSKGTFPRALSARYGATVCMGWTFVKPNHFILAFFGRFIEALKKTPRPDDQRSFNTLLVSFFCEDAPWSLSPTLMGSQTSPLWAWTRVRDPGIPEVATLVALLPYTLIRRRCQYLAGQKEMNDTLIFHCYTAKKSTSKRTELAKYGLWDPQADTFSRLGPD